MNTKKKQVSSDLTEIKALESLASLGILSPSGIEYLYKLKDKQKQNKVQK